ncbi:MAG: hypothetical protein EOO39_04045 [Cytophagaceae bacterium]|nr:MAG: hypothetical protein EOO39_04045 [Cytophagaceae bacterium]
MTTQTTLVPPTDQTYYVIDFDSTFTKVEALDILGEISLAGRPDPGASRRDLRVERKIHPEALPLLPLRRRALHRVPCGLGASYAYPPCR